MQKCEVCGRRFATTRALSSHITQAHKDLFISSKEYVVKYLYHGEEPKCKECGAVAASRGWKYFDYCLKCSDKRKNKKNNYDAHVFAEKIDLIIKKRNICFLGSFGDYDKYTSKTLRFQCNICGHTFITSMSLALNNKNSCPQCRVNPSQLPGVGEKISNSNKFSYKAIKQIFKKNKNFVLLTPYKDYKNYSYDKLKVKCKKCGSIAYRTLCRIDNGSFCFSCSPCSKEEQQIYEYIVETLQIPENEISRGDRKIIKPLELDIYLPNYNFAIEYNGLFWHNENNKEKKYHYNKTKQCQEKNITLFHIFSDEWQEKGEIIRSMISYKLKKLTNKEYARNCVISLLSTEEEKSFFNDNHISGYVPSKICYGLKNKEGVVLSAMSFKKPVQKEKYNDSLEVLRFANKTFYNVPGAFGKLLSIGEKYARDNEYKKILSYADMRFGNGNVYYQSGFEFLGETPINYWYTDNYKRYNRFKFRAQSGMSEKQVAKLNKVSKVHGCSHLKFSKVL